MKHLYGIYALCDPDGNIKYIGRSTKLFERIPDSALEQREPLKHFRYFITNNALDIFWMEPYIIQELQPKNNLEFKNAPLKLTPLKEIPSFSKVIPISSISNKKIPSNKKRGLNKEERIVRNKLKEKNREHFKFYHEIYGHEHKSIYQMTKKYKNLFQSDLYRITYYGGKSAKGWTII